MSPRTGRSNPTYYDGDLRQDLIHAATALIGERGASAVSLREVARRVGVSHAAPAHHFGDRSGLLIAVAAAGFDAFADVLEESVRRAAESPLGPLVASGAAYVGYAADNLPLFDVLFRSDLLAAHDPSLRAASDRALAVLQSGVDHAQDAGWAPGRDRSDMALTCWSLAHGLAVLVSMGAVPGGLDEAEQLNARALEAFWGPSRTSRRRGRR